MTRGWRGADGEAGRTTSRGSETGFLVVLLLYVWLGEFWVAAYNVIDYPSEAKAVRRLLHFHPTSLILAAFLIGAAWFYKKHLAVPEDQAGFPGYFIFLVVGALLPAVSFFPVARRFVNWRALSLTLFFMLLVSLLWEATLAVPYHWWGFQHHQMTGFFIGAWSGLPIEEVCVPLRQAVEARLPNGGSEREPSGARPAADGGATNAGRRDTGAAHHANLRLEDHVDVPPLRDAGTQRAAAGTREARRV